MAGCLPWFGLAPIARAGNPAMVEAIRDLRAFWTFGETAGQPRLARGGGFPLADGHATPVARVAGGPFSGFSASFNGTQNFLTLPNAALGALNISGPDAQVTVIAWIRRDDTNVGFLAGIWQEDDNDPRRQYGLFLDLPTYGGDDNVCGHVSWSGGPSPKFAGSSELLPYSRDYSANRSPVPNAVWSTAAFTYDGTYARSYLDGRFEERPTYTEPGAPNGYGLSYAKNPYLFEAGLGNNGGNFTVGAVKLTEGMRNHYRGEIGGVAVFSRALGGEEMFRAHAAMLEAGQPVTVFPFANAGTVVTAVSGAYWKAFRNATTSATTTTGNGWGISGSAGTGTEAGYLFKNLFSQAGIAWSDAVPAIPATVLERVEFTLNNNSALDMVRLAVRIGGQWFITTQTFRMNTAGISGTDWSGAENKTFAWTRAAAAWQSLAFNQSNTLAAGPVLTENLPAGELQAIGFYQAPNGGILRIDNLRIFTDAADVANSHKTGWRWLAEHFDRAERVNALVSGHAADPDGDGRPNLLERAFGSDPRRADGTPGQPMVSRVGDRLALTYRPVDPALAYTVEVSGDLGSAWDSGAEHVEILPDADPASVTAADRVEIPAAARRFIRLRVTDSGD